jgi:hypothetical protein
MKFWAIPSWNGDFRLTPKPDDDNKTLLSVTEPTPDELRIVNEIGIEALKQGWLKSWETQELPGSYRKDRQAEFELGASIAVVGPVVSKIVKPGPAVLSAVLFKDGRMETTSGSLAELQRLSQKAEKEGAKAATTVKRPTPCCPDCEAGAVGPASDVLLAFLSESEHAMWARERSIVVEGGLTGHRYRLSHRNTKRAESQRRICYDLDDRNILHFHDWSVPPEEEVLASKLILEHHEDWLRNEATTFHMVLPDMVFKNPFGGFDDGVKDSALVATIGRLFGMS